MDVRKKKIYLSLIIGAIFLFAVSWLVFRIASKVPVEEDRLYIIGRDSTWYPIDLRGKEKNMVGFSNDLVRAIGEEQGFRPRIIEVGPNALFDGLDLKRYDAVLSSFTPTVMNRRFYGFSDPFYLVGPVLVVPVESEAKSLEDMAGKIIGIERRALQVFNIPKPRDVVIIPYDTAAIALEYLDEQVVDGVIVNALMAHVNTEGFYAGRLKVATSPFTNKGLRLITRNEPKSLLLISRFNKGLEKIKTNGRYDQLIQSWGLINTEVKPENE